MPDPVIRLWDEPPPMEAGAPAPVVLCDGQTAYVAYGISSVLTESKNVVAVLKFEMFYFIRFGYPGEDDLVKHPLHSYGLKWYRFHIIDNSPLVQELGGMNLTHWFIAFHDESLEVVAAKASVQLDDKWISAEDALWNMRRVIEPAEQEAREDLNFYKSLAPEIGPEKCNQEQCTHQRISLSVKCIRHHFEMVKRKPCPY